MKNKSDAYAFISYSSANKQEARMLYDTLTNNFYKVTCWLDAEDLEFDQNGFPVQLHEGIRNSSCIVHVKTEEAQKSNYVDLELKTAREFNIPVFHYKVKDKYSKITNAINIFFLAQRIKMRITMPFWITLSLFGGILALMAVVIFLFGSSITPVIAEVADRVLPDALHSAKPTNIVDELPPEIAAPFKYMPQYALLQDDFAYTGEIGNQFFYDIVNTQPEFSVSNGALDIYIPSECSENDNRYPCEFEIHSQTLDLETLQYFGFRARINQIAEDQNLSLSISLPSWTRRRTGFGWNLAEHVTPFFRSFQILPEQDFFAHVNLDNLWHAYEILLDAKSTMLYYYIDGQLVGTHLMNHYEDWKDAPFCLIIYTLRNEHYPDVQYLPAETHIQIDEILIGGFN